MHYYSFHIGDFRSATVHFTTFERWVYRDLLDCLYDTEEPLPLDISKIFMMIGARSEEHKEAVKLIIETKFIKTETGYTNHRFESELEKYRSKATRAREANAARWGSDKSLKSDVKSDAFYIPTNNQEPITKKKNINTITSDDAPVSRTKKIGKPDDVSDDVWAAWLDVRKSKKATSLSEIVIEKVKREATKAEMSLNDVLTLCVEKNWISFEHSWISNARSVHLSSTGSTLEDAL